MKKSLLLSSLLFFVFYCETMFSQEKLRIAFWNLENFFDPFVDSTKSYNEYTENGAQHWTLQRFYKKRNNIYKTIISLSEREPLAVLGICEIENTFVTAMLFNDTPLKKHNYRIVHYECDDRRGIDVALAYSIDKLTLVSSEAVKVVNPENRRFRTRDILYAKFCDKNRDTLHCFVNHWPSRYGGEKETISLRELAARVLRNKIDSIIEISGHIPKIVIMGDFNDSPSDNSILKQLRAKPIEFMSKSDTLINLFSNNDRLGHDGTLKYQYRWQIFDQIIISKSLYDDAALHYVKESASIFHNDFLFVEDETYGGKKLFRTYIGPKYQGGFSDHLPVYIDLQYSQ